jgi:hypothetical protein
MNAPMQNLLEDVVLDLGADVDYIRPDGGRVYLSGAEIAFVIAVGLLIRFIEGYLDGLVKKPGEKLGEEHGAALIKMLRRLADRLLNRHGDETDRVLAQAEAAAEELQLLLPRVEEVALTDGGMDVAAARAAAEGLVCGELTRLGFPSDMAEQHAASLARRVTPEYLERIIRSGQEDSNAA